MKNAFTPLQRYPSLAVQAVSNQVARRAREEG